MTNRWRNAAIAAGLLMSDGLVALTALAYGGNVAWSVLYMLVVLTLYEFYVLFWPMSTLAVSRRIRSVGADGGIPLSLIGRSVRVFAMQSLELVCQVTCRHRWPAPLLRVTQGLSPAHGESVHQRTATYFANWHRKLTASATIAGLHRGVYVWDHVMIEVSDALGLVRRQVHLSDPLHVTVLPQLADISFWHPSYRHGMQTDAVQQHHHGLRQTGFAEPDAQSFHLRPYAPGDSVSRIHWRASAHAGQLLTKRDEPTTTMPVWIWVDDQCAVTESASLERRLSIAASLLVRLDYQRIPVRLSLSSQQGDPAGGIQQAPPVHHGYLNGLDALAAVEAGRTGDTADAADAPEHRLGAFLATCKLENNHHIIVISDGDSASAAVAAWVQGGGSIEWLRGVGA